ncbi:hypothetical protein SNE40_015822 [Patella caerulea]|uniref:Uncharacterized protein n=1 Tax=Patella caerulea TaxID=87958 RepID=A0AAN8JLG1_PATCE
MHKEALAICSQDTSSTTMSRMSNYLEMATWNAGPLDSSYYYIYPIKTRDMASTSNNIWVTTTGQPRQPPSSLSNTMAYTLIGVLTAAVVGLGLVISYSILVCWRKRKSKKDKAATSKHQHRSETTDEERMENIYVVS